MKNRPTGPTGQRGRVTQPRNIPRWWTQTAQQAREYNFVGPRDFRPPSQRTPGPNRYNHRGAGAPPPAARTEYSVGGGPSRSAQILGPGITPVGRSPVPQIKRQPSRQIYRPPTQTEWAQNYKAARAANALRKLITRANPYMTALDVGFQLLDAWTNYGPSEDPVPGEPAHWDFTGSAWSMWQSCEENGPWSHFGIVNSTAQRCITGQSLSALYPDFETMIAERPNVNRVGSWRQYPISGGLVRYALVHSFERPTGAANRYPLPTWVPEGEPTPGRKTVQPSPAALAPALPVNHERETPPRATHRPAPVIDGWLKPETPTRPSEIPANTIEVNPGGIKIPPQRPHVQAPHTGKEVKLNVQKGSPLYKVISDIYGGVTEAKDFVDVIVDSVEGNPCKGLAPVQAMHCVGKNWDKIDWAKVVSGLVYNHYEDKAVGAFLSYGRKSPYGVHTPTTGPSRRISPRNL